MKRAGIKPLAKSSRHKMSMSPSLYFPTAVIGLVKNHSGQTSAREKRRRHASLRTTYALGTPHISVLYNLSFLELGSEQNHSVRRVQAVPIYHFGVGMMLDKLHLQRISPGASSNRKAASFPCGNRLFSIEISRWRRPLNHRLPSKINIIIQKQIDRLSSAESIKFCLVLLLALTLC